MDTTQFIESCLDYEQKWLFEEVTELTSEQLGWRPTLKSNHIRWIVWHMFRVEDFWIQFFIQAKLELWESNGWYQKFNLPTRDTGFQHSAEQIADFPDIDFDVLLQYGCEVRSATSAYLSGLIPSQYLDVPRSRRPEMSIGEVFRQITGEFYQHLGHISYIKGLMKDNEILTV